MFRAKIIVTLRPSILDPQGSVITRALNTMELEVQHVRAGKFFDVSFLAKDEVEAQAKVVSMCEKLLINMITEDYAVLELTRVEG